MVRDIKLSHLSQDVVVSLNSALEDWGVSNVEFKVLLLQSLTSSDGFLHTIGGEVNVIPASESVLQIPYGLTVSEEYNSVGSFGCFLHDLN